jgi:hypothetical protein
MAIDTQANNPAVEQKESLSIVDEAKKLRDEIRAENDRRERILQDEQKLHAERLLSGTAGAPVNQTILTEEDQKKKAAMEFWKGTGIDEAIAKNG